MRKRNNNQIYYTLLLAIVSFLLACSTYNFNNTNVDLLDIRVAQVNILNSSLLAKLKIGNQNSLSMPLEAIVANLSLDGKFIGQGMKSLKNQEIAPYSYLEVELPISFSNLSAVTAVSKWFKKSEFDYSLEGFLKLSEDKVNGKEIKFYKQDTLRFQ